LLSAFAAVINDCNNSAIATYNSFSPATAQGVGLSNVVKINGIRREVASNSSADVLIVGQPYTIINNGVVGDEQGNQWLLPAAIEITPAGSITVTAVCTALGAITAAAGTINQIITPTLGWQSVTNPADATVGAPIEDDATLRQRQSASTALAAQTPLESIVAAVRNLPGVQEVAAYENDTSTTDANGIPPHSISLVVKGGDDVQIATAIADKKNPGTGTYGTTTETIIDQNGVPNTIHFFRPTEKRVIATVNITALPGFVSTTEAAIAQAMSDWVAAMPIGDPSGVAYNDLIAAAKLPPPLGPTYKIEYGALQIAYFGGTLGTADLPLAFNEEANLATTDITITAS